MKKIFNFIYFHGYFCRLHIVTVYTTFLKLIVSSLKLLVPGKVVFLIINIIQIILYLLLLFIIINNPLILVLIGCIIFNRRLNNIYWITFLFISISFVFTMDIFYMNDILICMEDNNESTNEHFEKAPPKLKIDVVLQNPIIKGHIANAVSEISYGVPVTKAACDPKMINAFEEHMTASAIEGKGFIESAQIRLGSKTFFDFVRASCEEALEKGKQ
jgi:hypothetical protein